MASDRDVQADLSALLARVCEGNDAAWQVLWAWLDPRLEALLRRPRFLPRLAQREDDRRAVVLAVMTKLRADGFRRLKLFVAGTTGPSNEAQLLAWLAVVAKRIGIDHLRGHPEYLDQRHAEQGPAGIWIEPGPLPSDSRMPGLRPPVTTRGTAAEMLAYARRTLPEAQHQALELWVQGQDPIEIAAALGSGTPAQAEQLLRAAVMRLRRRFRSSVGGRAT
jgi:DNA-directed RNA polymerase specialized sigma24 family protein